MLYRSVISQKNTHLATAILINKVEDLRDLLSKRSLRLYLAELLQQGIQRINRSLSELLNGLLVFIPFTFIELCTYPIS